MLLENKEGLEIEIKDTPHGFCGITVNGFDYAQFQDADIDDIDLDKLVYWIEETYYSEDYKSEAYTPSDLHLDEFSK